MDRQAQKALKPLLDSVTESAIRIWQDDMLSLFHDAQNRFPDIVWEMEDGRGGSSEKIWGHRAIIHARIPSGSQSQGLSMPSHGSTWPDFTSRASIGFRRLEIPLTNGSSYFIDELRYLYTNQSLIDFQKDSGLNIGRDELQEDLNSMLRSQQYADIEIAVPDRGSPWCVPVVFPSHRFILSSRSPYFFRILAQSHEEERNKRSKIALPYSSFTPKSFSFILGYLYSGTLKFTQHEWDLTTAFYIYR
ncbi:hypothetical protein GALMADRAFT_128543, partial [Galerina marginata CBS 339.88]